LAQGFAVRLADDPSHVLTVTSQADALAGTRLHHDIGEVVPRVRDRDGKAFHWVSHAKGHSKNEARRKSAVSRWAQRTFL
jgi:hypothetical protein